MPDAETMKQLVQGGGLLAVVMFGMYLTAKAVARVSSWLVSWGLTPVRDEVIETFKAGRKHLQDVGENMQANTACIQRFTDSESKQCVTLEAINNHLGEQSGILRSINDTQKEHGRMLQRLSGEHKAQS